MELVILLSVVALIIGICLFIMSRKSKSETPVKEVEKKRQPVARNENVPRVRRARNRMVHRNEEEDEDDHDPAMFDNMAQPEGKIGAKKMKKLEEKAEKKARREAEMEEREDRKKEDLKRDSKIKKENELKEANELLQLKEEEEQRLEKERKEHEEYLKMKEQFSVEESGVTEVLEENESLLTDFINNIKERKVIMLEDLAAEFKIKTQDCIDRITALIEEQRLTGVFDDRGKFIYITMDEYELVAEFIRKRGRIAISDLADASSSLINLNTEIANKA